MRHRAQATRTQLGQLGDRQLDLLVTRLHLVLRCGGVTGEHEVRHDRDHRLLDRREVEQREEGLKTGDTPGECTARVVRVVGRGRGSGGGGGSDDRVRVGVRRPRRIRRVIRAVRRMVTRGANDTRAVRTVTVTVPRAATSQVRSADTDRATIRLRTKTGATGGRTTRRG